MNEQRQKIFSLLGVNCLLKSSKDVEPHVSTKLSISSTRSKFPNHLIKLNKLYTHLVPFSSIQLGICHVFLLLGGAAAVSLKQLGQEEGFAKWPLWPQPKHSSAS